jgi:hypothetical protein
VTPLRGEIHEDQIEKVSADNMLERVCALLLEAADEFLKTTKASRAEMQQARGDLATRYKSTEPAARLVVMRAAFVIGTLAGTSKHIRQLAEARNARSVSEDILSKAIAEELRTKGKRPKWSVFTAGVNQRLTAAGENTVSERTLRRRMRVAAKKSGQLT